MATFQDNINTIQTAVYGKDMRPAISEALTQSWDAVKSMMVSVDRLNDRVNSLPGGSTDPDDPDIPIDPTPTPSENRGSFADYVSYIPDYSAYTKLEAAGNAERFI